MTSTGDDFVMTTEEVKIAGKTLHGISEMLSSIMSRYAPKDYAKALCGAHRQSTKSRTRTATLDYIVNEGHYVEEEPHYILQKLPSNLQDIDGSDFTDILQQFCRTFFLRNIRDKPKENRGRPDKPAYEETDSGGRYSSYQSSPEYLEQVVHTLEKPEVGQIISELLLENGLLYKYQKYTNEILYFMIRVCGEEKLRNIVKDLGFANAEISKKNPKVIEAFLNKIKGIPEGDIELEAEKATQKFLITQKTGNNNFFIYVIAGVISLANIF
jgi:hypothetical protein